MINLYNAHIVSLSIHRVGNKSKNEPLVLSSIPFEMDDEITPLLKEFFFKPFREKEENYYHFVHETDIEFHEMHSTATRIFKEPDCIHTASKEITKHLYNQATHPHIKSGEVWGFKVGLLKQKFCSFHGIRYIFIFLDNFYFKLITL